MPIEISYGSLEQQKIDFYEGKSDKILIWVHGGGWLFGDKSSERWVRRFHNHFSDHEKRNIYMIGYRTGEATAPNACLLYTSPSPRDKTVSRMPSSA